MSVSGERVDAFWTAMQDAIRLGSVLYICLMMLTRVITLPSNAACALSASSVHDHGVQLHF